MDRILEILAEKKMTKTAFADLVGVKNQNVNAMLKNPTRETYEKIASALGVEFWELFASKKDIVKENEEVNSITCPHCGKSIELEVRKE